MIFIFYNLLKSGFLRFNQTGTAGVHVYFIVFYFDSLFHFSHPDLHTKDGAEFLRVSAAYQRILNKKSIIYDVPQGPQGHYYRPDIRAYPGETFIMGRILFRPRV